MRLIPLALAAARLCGSDAGQMSSIHRRAADPPGPGGRRFGAAWHMTAPNYHQPEKFGVLVLDE